MNFLDQLIVRVRPELAEVETVEVPALSQEAQLVDDYQHKMLIQTCNALLLKNYLDNTAALVAYGTYLSEVAPGGAEMYAALVKSAVLAKCKELIRG